MYICPSREGAGTLPCTSLLCLSWSLCGSLLLAGGHSEPQIEAPCPRMPLPGNRPLFSKTPCFFCKIPSPEDAFIDF